MDYQILNRFEATGNLVAKPEILTVGARQFIRARLAQNWDYDTHGSNAHHRQFLQLVFVADAASQAKHFDKGDFIYVVGAYIRRAVRQTEDSPDSAPERNTTHEIHVTTTFRIGHGSQPAPSTDPVTHQAQVRRAGNPQQFQFVKESLNDWPTC